jgi:hypothetical protein
MTGTMPAMTPDQDPACAGEPLFFSGLRAPPQTGERALGRRGSPRFPPALPRPGKNHPAVGPATLRDKCAMRHGAEKCPAQRMDNASARRVGALFARRSPAHKQKVCQRGLRGKGPIMRKNAAVGEG